MPEQNEASTQKPETINPKKQEALVKELGGIIANDISARYRLIPVPKAKLFYRSNKYSLGGEFPSSVAYYTIGSISALIFLFIGINKENSFYENMAGMSLFIGSSLVGQVIHTRSSNRPPQR